MDVRHGNEFEDAFAKEMGLSKVPGSGNQWHSKLDLKGFAARWSLKSTRKKTYELSGKLIEEVETATGGPGGTGELALHSFQMDGEWFVLMRARDFKLITQEQLVLSRESKADARRRTATTPSLLREDY